MSSKEILLVVDVFSNEKDIEKEREDDEDQDDDDKEDQDDENEDDDEEDDDEEDQDDDEEDDDEEEPKGFFGKLKEKVSGKKIIGVRNHILKFKTPDNHRQAFIKQNYSAVLFNIIQTILTLSTTRLIVGQ